MLYAARCMLHAARCMLYAACCHASCRLQHRSARSTTHSCAYSIHTAYSSMRHAACSTQDTMRGAQPTAQRCEHHHSCSLGFECTSRLPTSTDRGASIRKRAAPRCIYRHCHAGDCGEALTVGTPTCMRGSPVSSSSMLTTVGSSPSFSDFGLQHTRAHSQTHAARAHTHTHTHTHTHARTHACTHARTHARTHKQI
jgi:hypothetical protein